jgi:two-component system phosphate regulon sensor histidine kinase PhoR
VFGNRKEIAKLKSDLDGLKDKVSSLERSNAYLLTVFESMVEGVITVDSETRITSINPSVEEIFGISKRESQGKFFLEAIRNNSIAEVISQVLKNAEFVSKELTLVWPIQRVLQINASPIFENKTVTGCVAVIHDITQIRKLEQMRSDFVANVSHELKTPLTSIKGFVETLLETALKDKENSRHFLKVIQEHTNRLDSLINDLLELSHIESKEIKLKIEEIKLVDLVNEVLRGFKNQLKKTPINVNNNLSSGLTIKADKDKLERVLVNLIDNAIKFNKEKGSINIYSEESGNNIKIVIEDSGIGIPAKDIPRIFERFYRVDKARSRELGGTGLGLSIVKHIIELHGGSVGVESTEGLGSKFCFTLPKR